MAVKEFKDVFRPKYVKPDSTAANDVALAQAFDQAGCFVCHASGDNKKIRNDYGKQLAKLLSKARTRRTRRDPGGTGDRCQAEKQAVGPHSPTFGRRSPAASCRQPTDPAAARQHAGFAVAGCRSGAFHFLTHVPGPGSVVTTRTATFSFIPRKPPNAQNQGRASSAVKLSPCP